MHSPAVRGDNLQGSAAFSAARCRMSGVEIHQMQSRGDHGWNVWPKVACW
jgi:hypothetical protein